MGVACYVIILSVSNDDGKNSIPMLQGISAAIILLAFDLVVQRATRMNELINKVDVGFSQMRKSFTDLGAHNVDKFYSSVRNAPLLQEYLKDAKHEFFLAGPSRYSIVRKNMKEKLMEKAKWCNVKILIIRKDSPAIDSIQKFDKSKLKTELSESYTTFLSWVNYAKENGRKVFVKLHPFIPYTVNIIDGNSDNGRMVVILQRYSPDIRPCFEISKRDQPELFTAIYKHYTEMWDEATSIDNT